jgi:CRISPR type III-B/RAMP module-associated protein Cmr5
MKTVDQELAAAVYGAVCQRVNMSQAEKEDYARWAKSLPGFVAQSGLVTALAYYDQKATKPGIRNLFDDLRSVLYSQRFVSQNQGNFAEQVAQMDVLDAILLQDAIDRAVVFFKAFSQSVLNVDAAKLEATNE